MVQIKDGDIVPETTFNKILNKSAKLSNIDFSGLFYSWFSCCWNFPFWWPADHFPIISLHFRDFLEISYFPKVLSLRSFGNSWHNSYIPFFVIIIFLPCFSGEQKFCWNVKKSTNIFSMIVDKKANIMRVVLQDQVKIC